MTKQELRRLMKEAQADFLASGKAEAESAALWNAVENSDEFRTAATVLIYMDIPGEVPTADFIWKWRDQKEFLIPRVCGENLELCTWDPEKLVAGYRGILEPSDDAEKRAPETVQLALIPGVAFSKDGLRLGRGKGFYDRLLPKLHCICAGIGFSFRWLDEIPHDSWDVPVSTKYRPH